MRQSEGGEGALAPSPPPDCACAPAGTAAGSGAAAGAAAGAPAGVVVGASTARRRAKGLLRSWSFSDKASLEGDSGGAARATGSLTTARASFELCECGKSMFQAAASGGGERLGKGARRPRAQTISGALSPSSSQSDSFLVGVSFGSSAQRAMSRARRATGDVDIEDVVAEPDEEDLSGLVHASPQVTLTPASHEEEEAVPSVCERCQRSDCVTVKPTVGYYTARQVAKHSRVDDCWIVAHGNVYDVTRYLPKHPGGAKSVLSRAGGVDASQDFDFHSRYSKKRLWTRYKIGRLAVCTNRPARDYLRRTSPRGQGATANADGGECRIS